jgi:hypothetical protein
MGAAGTAVSCGPHGSPSTPQSTPHRERMAVRAADRLRLALAARRLAGVAKCVRLPEKVAPRRHPGAHPYRAARSAAGRCGARSAAPRWECGPSIGEDDQWRRSAGRRRGPRSWSDANALSWWRPKDCSWRSMSIPPPSWTGMGANSCSTNRPGLSGPGGGTSGAIRALRAAAKAATGSRRWWVGRSRCCARSLASSAIGSPTSLPKDQIDWSKYLPEPGFHVLARRWVVARTFAWLRFNRRLSRE